jgi:hypothetical protein
MKKVGVFFIILIALFASVFIFTGFFVIQPIGALPEGLTIWYFRIGTNLPFISSADGLLLKKEGSISIMSRMITMTSLLEETKKRMITRLPYMRGFYLISTNGQEYN